MPHHERLPALHGRAWPAAVAGGVDIASEIFAGAVIVLAIYVLLFE